VKSIDPLLGKETMKIAQVSPLYESVPPQLYGGTERVVSYLTEELVRQGHHVTLFATGDSQTSARLIAPCPCSLRLTTDIKDPLAHHMIMLDQVCERADEFDVIHFHTDYLHFCRTRSIATPYVTTLHGRLDLPDLPALYRRFHRQPLVSISDAQRRPLAWANWQGTVYHGLPDDLYDFQPEPLADGALVFVGRISPEKRVDRAIEIAKRCERKLRIAAKVDPVDRDYFETDIKPLLTGADIEFVGEIGESEKGEFFGNAAALLFPIDWPEPFGLVMIESMACGTPVIAWNCGSVPEVISEGETGFVCEDLGGAVRAVNRIGEIDRRRCREIFSEKFQAARMTHDYIRIYERLQNPDFSNAEKTPKSGTARVPA
jgi:glycosyltransferase involved in cell wall biosynthesis